MASSLELLGLKFERPRVGFFDLTSCEGCQLQIVNNEGSLLDFLNLVEVVSFREAMTEHSDNYDIAFVEGSITRSDEVSRVQAIRSRAKVLIAFGSCAAFGGVNQIRNRFSDLAEVVRSVYGEHPVETSTVRAVGEVVPVDLTILGCPVRKEEVEKIVLNVVLGKTVSLPRYPVCMECKARENVCLVELGEPCIGPVTRAGCDAWCPSNRCGCWGCRGPADDPNVELMIRVLTERGISPDAIRDRLECFGGFASHTGEARP
jgi:coenzyme F420-reducing hydrogenase gamma subunit